MTIAQYLSPTGAMIVGLVRVADVMTYIAGFEPDGKPVVEPDENEVDWASLRGKQRAGEMLFQDENSEAWTFAELTRVGPECAPGL